MCVLGGQGGYRPPRDPAPRLCTQQCTHLDAHVGVMGIYPRPQVFASSLGPQEIVQELGAILEIVATHAPLPGLPALEARGVITRAPLHAASAAGPGQSVREGGRGHRIQEGRLLETWARGWDQEGEGEWAQGL